MAATTNPFPASSLAPSSICARPPVSPWWKTTSGAHRSAAFEGQGGGKVAVIFGTTISAGMTSMGGVAFGANRLRSKAPVVGLRRLGVGRFASITSRMLLEFVMIGSMPYLVNGSVAVPGVRTLIDPTKLTPGFLAESYGAAASWSAGAVIVCVRKVYAAAICSLVNGAAPPSLVIKFAIWTRILSSALACASEIPASCDLPLAHSGL